MTNEIFKSEIETISNESIREKFFNSNGRINRMTYFKRNFVTLALEFVALCVLILLGTIAGVVLNEMPMWLNLSAAVIGLAFLVPRYFLDVKRLHDLGKDSTLAKVFLGVGILSVAYDFAFPAVDTTSPVSTILLLATIGFSAYLLFMKDEDNDNPYGEVQ